jgi:putative oxidoreductase
MYRKLQVTSSAHFLLILLWAYAASAKLMDFANFKLQMHRQLLPQFLDHALPYLLPPFELGIALLLTIPKTTRLGLYLSLFLIALFTAYVGLMITGKFGKIPCSCGGIISHLGWNIHFYFNCFFLLINLIPIILSQKKGVRVTTIL